MFSPTECCFPCCPLQHSLGLAWHVVWRLFVWYLILTVSWLWHDTGLTGGQNVRIITRQVSSSLSSSLTDLFNFRIFPINSHISDRDSQQIKILLQSICLIFHLVFYRWYMTNMKSSKVLSQTASPVSSECSEFSSNQLLAVSKHINPSKV